MSILDPSYMIDLGEIDVIQSQGVAIPGLYQKLLDNIGPCGNPLIYNWKFNGIFIPPQYVEPILEDDAIYINDIYVSSDDVLHIPSIEIPPRIVQLNVLENGEYPVIEGIDGYGPVIANVQPAISLLNVTENGTYEVPEGVDGFNPVVVNVSGGFSEDVERYFDTITPMYSGGYEYNTYIYSTSKISDWNLTLLHDASQGADAVELSSSIYNFSGVILQGIYQKNRTSGYNTTLLYMSPALNTQYWAGMRDRNQSYTCYVTFTDSTHATLAGNKQVLIYGIP